jgi:hypothetical protein
MRYSPRPLTNYIRKSASGEPAGLATSAWLENPAVWNLFYLSEPQVEICATWPQDDIHNIPQHSDMLWPCVLLCRTNLKIAEWLVSMSAVEFVAAIKKENYREMPPYRMLGEQWLEIMEIKARGPRGISKQEGNLITANFGGRFLKDIANINSCDIMTLSSTRH